MNNKFVDTPEAKREPELIAKDIENRISQLEEENVKLIKSNGRMKRFLVQVAITCVAAVIVLSWRMLFK
jgi:hypothetical protein